MQAREQTVACWSEVFGGVELLAAQYTSHRFAPHAHEEYVLGAVESGCERFRWRGRDWLAPAGSLLLVGPEETHTGAAHGRRPWRYRALYPSAAWVSAVAGVSGGQVVRFRAPVVRDPVLARRLAAVHAAISSAAPAGLDAQEQLAAVIGDLVRTHAVVGGAPRWTGRHPAVRRARALLEANYDRNVDLDELAEETALSKYHLVRLFTAEIGRSPHRVLTDLRVRAAKRKLADGRPPAEVAVSVGFYDQPHLTRSFKQSVGITPAVYARTRNQQSRARRQVGDPPSSRV